MMDCDVERRKTRSGRIATQLVLLPDADISDPENESDSDYEPEPVSDDSSTGSCSEDDLPLAELVEKEDDVPLSKLFSNEKNKKSFIQVQSSSAARQASHVFRWRKMSIVKQSELAWKGQFSDPPQPKEPIDYFRQFFSRSLVDHITEQTNIYAIQCGSAFQTDSAEIEKYLGVLVKMGLVHMPRYHLYWSNQLRFPPVADVLSRKRFYDLNKHVHFSDNSKVVTNRTDDDYDRYYKVRPLLNSLREACLQLEPEEKMSVDEQMIPYKGKNSLRQYIPNKPKKWGFKVLARCGVSGLTYDFHLYDGKGPVVTSSCGYQPGDFVIKLCETLPKGMNFKLFFDNWFTFLELQIILKSWSIWTVGTVRSNRLRGCMLKSEKELKHLGRGSSDMVVDANSGLTVVRWLDNSAVQLSSTHAAMEPITSIRRWDRKQHLYISIPCPAIVTEYNQHMGGVDLFDVLMSLYKVDHKGKKWYRRVLLWALNLAVVNGWLLYRRHVEQRNEPKNNQLDLIAFTSAISKALTTENKLPPAVTRKRGRPLSFIAEDQSPSTSENETGISTCPKKRFVPYIAGSAARYDDVGHYPAHSEPKQRCRVCHSYVRMKCLKCNCHLCITKEKNCFLEYHQR